MVRAHVFFLFFNNNIAAISSVPTHKTTKVARLGALHPRLSLSCVWGESCPFKSTSSRRPINYSYSVSRSPMGARQPPIDFKYTSFGRPIDVQ